MMTLPDAQYNNATKNILKVFTNATVKQFNSLHILTSSSQLQNFGQVYILGIDTNFLFPQKVFMQVKEYKKSTLKKMINASTHSKTVKIYRNSMTQNKLENKFKLVL